MKHALLPAASLLLLTASATAQEAPAPATRPMIAAASQVPAPEPPDAADRPTRAFQVSLLLADVEGPGGTQGLSKASQKALEDLKDFLPFKSYRLLDFAWLRTAVRSTARVRGPEGRTLELFLNLGRPGDDPDQIYISSFELRSAFGMNLDVAAGPLRGSRSLISTSFGMTEGETVVVGTSRLESDQKALVVLLTAVPASLAGG